MLVSIRTLTMIFLLGWCYWHRKLTNIILKVFKIFLKSLIKIVLIIIPIVSLHRLSHSVNTWIIILLVLQCDSNIYKKSSLLIKCVKFSNRCSLSHIVGSSTDVVIFIGSNRVESDLNSHSKQCKIFRLILTFWHPNYFLNFSTFCI